jgi:hypothetical protein
MAIFVPFPVLGMLLCGIAVWMHDAGLASPVGDWMQTIFFYGAILGITVTVL